MPSAGARGHSARRSGMDGGHDGHGPLSVFLHNSCSTARFDKVVPASVHRKRGFHRPHTSTAQNAQRVGILRTSRTRTGDGHNISAADPSSSPCTEAKVPIIQPLPPFLFCHFCLVASDSQLSRAACKLCSPDDKHHSNQGQD